MGADTSPPSKPDLFAIETSIESSSSSAKPISSPSIVTPTTATTSSPRHVLPANLPNAIKQLDDHEFGRLLSAVLDEQNWRGKKLPSAEPKQRLELAPNSLTRGQINAVRAAFKAGITPSQIARQFGLSQSDVRKSLASQDERNGEPVTLRAHLADLERQHKAIEGEIADALAHSSTDDLKIAELKRRKANTER